jgi:hypothetical protein
VANTIYSSSAFEKDYLDFTGPVQQLAEGAVRDLQNLIDSDPRTWRHDRGYLEGTKKKVLKLDVSSGHRLLAVDDGDVTLWRLGDHDIMKKVTANGSSFPKDRRPLPPRFRPGFRSRLLAPDHEFQDSSDLFASYLNENAREWIYQLGEEQSRIAREILSGLEIAYLEGIRRIYAVSGGPGTGKTAILVWLLKTLTDFDDDGFGLDVRISMPNQVLNQIRKSTSWELNEFLYEKLPDVVLVDDPSLLIQTHSLFRQYPDASFVVAFDPLQMETRVSDHEFQTWIGNFDVDCMFLSTCYRQKSNVGKAAKNMFDVVADSSPYLDEFKKSNFAEQAQEVTGISNEMEFVNPGGIYEVVDDLDSAAINRWIASLEDQGERGDLWTHLTPLLVVVDDKLLLSESLQSRISSIPHDQIVFSDSEHVKGMDYQHCMMILSKPLYKDISKGFEGSGRKSYDRFRLFRIPVSRPKDSLFVVVVGGLEI